MKKILPLALLFCFCSKTKDSSDTVVLNYNEKQLGSSMVSLGDSIQFQVPIDWSMADSAFLNLIDSTIYQDGGLAKKVFQDTVREAFLVCVENPPYQLNQDSLDLKSGKWLGLQHSDFQHNDLYFEQTVLQNEQVVLFKVNIKKSVNSLPISAVHYFIPRNTISSHATMVESSIASINN